ncbi:hypothetical protein LLEC1_01532 [Akanthomyces lecanii]|uniref:Uncharacterized protein n=1 Tax=Cordyceps confragosa TaxID=2714763 RepID=A0A179I2Z6_CORDF|nr:hypothetical protein LLEC1_01532 [Akanthomyces lecanii]
MALIIKTHSFFDVAPLRFACFVMDADPWLSFITPGEAAQIWLRFHDACSPNSLVLWSGVGFDRAQTWARDHGRRTLTQAMGPLMDKSDPLCPCHARPPRQWPRYVHAASILFALYVSTGREVVVLTPQPPQRLNPNRTSYYQNIEEPWITACCDESSFRIMFAHPRAKEARDYIYQYWPVDCVADWTAQFPGAGRTQHWTDHAWGAVERSVYKPSELQQRRKSILESLYLYRTGASVYWAAAASICAYAQSSLPTAAACQTPIAEPRPRKLTKSEKKAARREELQRRLEKAKQEAEALKQRVSKKTKRRRKREARHKMKEEQMRDGQMQGEKGKKAEKKKLARQRLEEQRSRAAERVAEEQERARERKEAKRKRIAEANRKADKRDQVMERRRANERKRARERRRAKERRRARKRMRADGGAAQKLKRPKLE